VFLARIKCVGRGEPARVVRALYGPSWPALPPLVNIGQVQVYLSSLVDMFISMDEVDHIYEIWFNYK